MKSFSTDDIVPLKFGVKYNPPCLALVYSVEGNSAKKYCHSIPVVFDSYEAQLRGGEDKAWGVEELGKRIYKEECFYLKNIKYD